MQLMHLDRSKILHPILMKEGFDKIFSGEKKVEYREIKPYWTKRLFNEGGSVKNYDYIYFRNEYSKDCPKMKVEFRGVRVGEEYEIFCGRRFKFILLTCFSSSVILRFFSR